MSDLAATQQVVFVDSNVPDIPDLVERLTPGARAFMLGPSSNTSNRKV